MAEHFDPEQLRKLAERVRAAALHTAACFNPIYNERMDAAAAILTLLDRLQTAEQKHLGDAVAPTVGPAAARPDFDALRKDAERYRWLREVRGIDNRRSVPWCVMLDPNDAAPSMMLASEEVLDAAIDAAIKDAAAAPVSHNASKT